MAERVLVLGAGMAGLFAALALAPGTRDILILDRDPPPPGDAPDAVFEDWRRRGVGQFRHSHGFLARLRSVIARRHPALLAALVAAGCEEIAFDRMMPAALRARYEPAPGDDEVVILTSRRSTFELVLRRYVEALPRVTLCANAFVRDLVIEDAGGTLRVAGARGERDGEPVTWRADIVVDAQGRLSDCAAQLAGAGAPVREAAEPCGILYFTRHFRQIGPEPPPSRATATGDLAYLKYGRFPGDNAHFSVTLAVPEIETALRQAVVDPAVFDRICTLLPGLAGWVAPDVAEPASRVYGMGDLESRWRRFTSPDRRAAHGFFALGDSLVRSNPLYGRGCTFAAVQSDILAGVLDDAHDPAVRARLYETRVETALRAYYDDMRAQDRGAIRRAEQALDPGARPTLQTRLLQSFVDDGVRIAVRGDLGLLRAAIREFNMLDPPGVWARQPATLVKAAGRWARGRRANAGLYPPPPGPGRLEMLTALGLSPAAGPGLALATVSGDNSGAS
ncbi:MAG TPA: FAD-binding protein [Caulobacteraceae bacterium]|nr:FAD-binding protein [Caulobacteraceae bacterium]